MDTMPKLMSIFAMAFFYFSLSIPAGIVLGLTPATVGVTAWLSYMAGVLVVALVGDSIRVRLMKRFNITALSNPNSRIRRIWDRFGFVGLSLLAPMTTGAQLGTVIGLTFGVPRRRLILGMAIGAALWAALITGAVLVGLVGVQAIR